LVGKCRAATFGHRPIRAPHHSASAAALVGGGSDPKPGEISLAHHGVLFLDEFAEYDRRILEVLREPLENRAINISRAARQVTYPANFMLVAAMNPCPDGFLGANISAKPCRCTPDQIARYRGRISGPLLDRIDMQIQVPMQSHEVLRGKGSDTAASEGSAQVRDRVIAADQRARARQGCPNANLSASDMQRVCALDGSSETLLQQASNRLGLSARAQHRVLRVARTIADLAGIESISVSHLAEALGYRQST
jgi:magnesium chelatase family protein